MNIQVGDFVREKGYPGFDKVVFIADTDENFWGSILVEHSQGWTANSALANGYTNFWFTLKLEQFLLAVDPEDRFLWIRRENIVEVNSNSDTNQGYERGGLQFV